MLKGRRSWGNQSKNARKRHLPDTQQAGVHGLHHQQDCHCGRGGNRHGTCSERSKTRGPPLMQQDMRGT